MTNLHLQGKPKAAMLTNVRALLELQETLKSRELHLPGLGVMYGPSGFGKSVAVAVGAASGEFAAVEIKPTWTRKAFLLAVAQELGVPPSKRDWETSQEIGAELAKSGRGLMIDEADILVDKGLIEIVRELHMGSLAPIILIGEEALHNKLKRAERVHNRVLKWLPAMPATLVDARQLVALHLDGLTVADDLLSHIVQKRRGIIRRIVVNLHEIQVAARREDVETATLDWWGDRPLDSGDAPNRRL